MYSNWVSLHMQSGTLLADILILVYVFFLSNYFGYICKTKAKVEMNRANRGLIEQFRAKIEQISFS